jgi:hypothetical protein
VENHGLLCDRLADICPHCVAVVAEKCRLLCGIVAAVVDAKLMMALPPPSSVLRSAQNAAAAADDDDERVLGQTGLNVRFRRLCCSFYPTKSWKPATGSQRQRSRCGDCLQKLVDHLMFVNFL